MNRLRREPRQARSRARVARILDAAAALADEAGVDGLAVAEIARRARVPIGTLYQFFASKDAVVHALAERFAVGFADVLERVLPAVAAEPDWRILLRRVLAAYADYYRTTPALRRLWVGARLDPAFLQDDRETMNPLLARRLADALAHRTRVPRDELALMVACAWEAGQALLELAFRSAPEGDPDILAQAGRLLERYFAPVFESPNASAPPAGSARRRRRP